jgi:hypothetical protein
MIYELQGILPVDIDTNIGLYINKSDAKRFSDLAATCDDAKKITKHNFGLNFKPIVWSKCLNTLLDAFPCVRLQERTVDFTSVLQEYSCGERFFSHEVLCGNFCEIVRIFLIVGLSIPDVIDRITIFSRSKKLRSLEHVKEALQAAHFQSFALNANARSVHLYRRFVDGFVDPFLRQLNAAYYKARACDKTDKCAVVYRTIPNVD